MQDIREGLGPKTYFKYDYILLKYCGIWPYQTRSSMIVSRFLWLFQEVFLALAESIKFHQIYKDIDILLELIPSFLYNRIIDVIFANGIINQRKMKNLLQKIQSHWNSLTDEGEIQILAETVEFGLFFNVGFIGMTYSAVLGCMFLPVSPLILDIIRPLNHSRHVTHLFVGEYFIDPQEYYFTILASNYVCALASPIPILGMDLFFMNCCNHICGITRVLGFRIDNVSKNVGLNNESKKSKYKQLCDCVDTHQIIFDFCDDINHTFNTNFLFVLFGNMILLSITGVAGVIRINEHSEINESVIRLSVFTSAQIVHLFVFNYTGQSILTAAEVLEEQIYNVIWYELPLKSQILVQLMILKNQRPKVIQGGIFPLSLPTFTTVMKTSFSYFTVIKSTL